MTLFDTNFTLSQVKDGLEDLSDLIRFQINRGDKAHLLNMLDFDNDELFLEPSSFFHFADVAKDPPNASLEQSLLFSLTKGSLEYPNDVYSDEQGLIHLPSYGYLVVEPKQSFELTFSASEQKIQLSKDGKDVSFEHKPFTFIRGTNIKLLESQSELLTNLELKTIFDEPMTRTVTENEEKIGNAIAIMKEIAPLFTEMVELVTRDITLFRSSNHFSMASINQFGSAFLNLSDENQNEPFFIEDIAHQCGHVIFYTLTMDAAKFFSSPKDTPLKDFTYVSYEKRDLYGAFHGLFTYTTIANCLDLVIEHRKLEGELLVETYARLAFFLAKFRKDLVAMEENNILSKLGFEYFDMFHSAYLRINEKHKHIARTFDFSNQNYLFSWKAFKQLNDVQHIGVPELEY